VYGSFDLPHWCTSDRETFGPIPFFFPADGGLPGHAVTV